MPVQRRRYVSRGGKEVRPGEGQGGVWGGRSGDERRGGSDAPAPPRRMPWWRVRVRVEGWG